MGWRKTQGSGVRFFEIGREVSHYYPSICSGQFRKAEHLTPVFAHLAAFNRGRSVSRSNPDCKIILLGVAVMAFGWFKKSKPQPPQNVYPGMRSNVLSLKPDEIGVVPTSEMPVVWGVLMETGYPSATVTLVSLADRTTSLYFSNGGGIIGAGQHAQVAQATIEFLVLAQKFYSQMQPTTTFPLPALAKVRFYLLTFAGVVTAEVDEEILGRELHRLSPLFHKAHEVIGNVRVCTDRTEK
jgi:hypothetical protein